VLRLGPHGDPLQISVRGSSLSFGRRQALAVRVAKVD